MPFMPGHTEPVRHSKGGATTGDVLRNNPFTALSLITEVAEVLSFRTPKDTRFSATQRCDLAAERGRQRNPAGATNSCIKRRRGASVHDSCKETDPDVALERIETSSVTEGGRMGVVAPISRSRPEFRGPVGQRSGLATPPC